MRHWLISACIALAVVLVSGSSVASIYAWQLTNRVGDNALDITNGNADAEVPPPTIGEIAGAVNVLAVGLDNVPDQSAAFGERDGTLNDVNILLHIAADHESAVVLSLPRDLIIPGPACTDPVTGETFRSVSAQPLNSAISRGGLGCVVSTVSELTGLTIPYAAVFSFEGTVAMSDAVGGVPICLDTAINDPLSGLDLPAGVSVVSGQQALSYLRSRKGVGDGSDLARISSQQSYMASLMRVMKSSDTLTDIPKVLRLANAAVDNVKLSDSLAPLPAMISMVLALKDVDLDKLTFVTYPSVPYTRDPNKVQPAMGTAEALMAKIRDDTPFTLDADALGNSLTVEATAPAATPAPAPSAPAVEPPNVIEGVRGVTGDQETCSVGH